MARRSANDESWPLPVRRRRRPADRRLDHGHRLPVLGWIALGLGVVALGAFAVGRGGGGRRAVPGYPPLDVPKPVAEGVFVVDGTLPGLLGTVLPVRMTVIRLPGGELLLHSPTRFSRRLLEDLERIGPVRHLVAPNVAHWTFLEDWQHALPEAKTWAAPGLRERAPVRHSGVRLDADLRDEPPAEWGGAVDLTVVRGGLGFHEVGLFHRPSRTLVLTDLVMNLEPGRLPGWFVPVAKLMGVTAPDGMPPPYLRAVVTWRRGEAVAAALRLLAQGPERVIFAHGTPFLRDGAAALRRSLRWLLGPRGMLPAGRERGAGSVGG